MHAQCHRCHGELPEAAGYPQDRDEIGLFCPRCSAPQLLLPEHMRIDDPVMQTTTGTLPPPRVAGSNVREIDWHSALPKAAGVAVVGAVLTVLGLRVNSVALLSLCWLLFGAVISLGLYSRRFPRVWMDGHVGLRVGVVTGLLMLGALAIAGAGTGAILRFGTHGLQGFDQRNAEQAKLAQAWGVRWLQDQNQDKEVQDRYLQFVTSPAMTSPEMRAGTELSQWGFEAMLLLGVSAGTGGFAGMVQRRRGATMRGD